MHVPTQTLMMIVYNGDAHADSSDMGADAGGARSDAGMHTMGVDDAPTWAACTCARVLIEQRSTAVCGAQAIRLKSL